MRSPQYGNSPGRGIEKERAQHACGLTHFRLRSPGPQDTHPCPWPLASGQWKNEEDTVRLTPTSHQASDPQEPFWTAGSPNPTVLGNGNEADSICLRFLGWSFYFIYSLFFRFPKTCGWSQADPGTADTGMFPAHKEREVGSPTGRRDARPTAAEIPAGT